MIHWFVSFLKVAVPWPLSWWISFAYFYVLGEWMALHVLFYIQCLTRHVCKSSVCVWFLDFSFLVLNNFPLWKTTSNLSILLFMAFEQFQFGSVLLWPCLCVPFRAQGYTLLRWNRQVYTWGWNWCVTALSLRRCHQAFPLGCTDPDQVAFVVGHFHCGDHTQVTLLLISVACTVISELWKHRWV